MIFEKYMEWLAENEHVRKALQVALRSRTSIGGGDGMSLAHQLEFKHHLRKAGYGHVDTGYAEDHAGNALDHRKFKIALDNYKGN